MVYLGNIFWIEIFQKGSVDWNVNRVMRVVKSRRVRCIGHFVAVGVLRRDRCGRCAPRTGLALWQGYPRLRTLE